MDFFFRYNEQVGIPVFFLLSGMGSIYYDTEKKGFIRYAINKTQRLILPVVFSIPLFIIPRLYVTQSWDDLGRVKKGTEIEWNIFKYLSQIFLDNFVMKLGHLWFLPVLLLVCLVNYPLLAYSRRRMKMLPVGRKDVMIIIAQFIAIMCLTLLFFVLTLNDPDDFWYYLLPANLTLYCGMLAYMGVQVYLQRLADDDHGKALFVMLIGPVISILVNNFKYAS